MPSTFGWVDLDEASRRKMLDVVSLFETQDTLDELGIGTIRDALADYFFPGTSTIQTRAKYFLLVPWIYLHLEKNRVPSKEIKSKGRRDEMGAIKAFLASGAGDNDGVIGRIAREELRRLPSSVYWVGLRTWGIRQFHGSQDLYHRSLDGFYQRRQEHRDRAETGEEPAKLPCNWHPNMPLAPPKWRDSLNMDLEHEEALYLRERITISCRDSLLAALVNAESFLESPRMWDNLVAQKSSPAIEKHVQHARNFAELIHGAAILYNHMLADCRDNKELLKTYSKQFSEWSKLIASRTPALRKWQGTIKEFWDSDALAGAKIPLPTRKFIEDWCLLALRSGGAGALLKDSHALALIRKRETDIKRHRARLGDDPRYLELWNGASNIGMLDYRWGNTLRIVNDIREGAALKKH